MDRKILRFRQDAAGDWMAELECGHLQHVRHDPPWLTREWVLTEAGRLGRIGTALWCRLCDERPGPITR